MNPIKYLADAVWLKSYFNEHVSKSDFFETDLRFYVVNFEIILIW